MCLFDNLNIILTSSLGSYFLMISFGWLLYVLASIRLRILILNLGPMDTNAKAFELGMSMGGARVVREISFLDENGDSIFIQKFGFSTKLLEVWV